MLLAQGHNEMCTGGESNQGPLGPKSDALSTAPLCPPDFLCFDVSLLFVTVTLRGGGGGSNKHCLLSLFSLTLFRRVDKKT